MKEDYTWKDCGIHVYKNGKINWSAEFVTLSDFNGEKKKEHVVIISVGEVSGLRFSHFSLVDGNILALREVGHFTGISFPKQIWEIILQKLQEIHISKIAA